MPNPHAIINQMSKLKRTYAAVGRLSHKAMSPIMKRVVTEKHVRVRVLIVNEDKEILLVKSWLGHQTWSLPGGGIRRSESPAEAAAREVYEETGLRIAADHLQELGSFENGDSSTKFTVQCFYIEVAKREPRIARRHRLEMLDIAWFPMAKLPKPHGQTIDSAIALFTVK